MTTPRDPRPVILSDRLYRLLLRAYPRRFRHGYEDEMAQLFRDCCRDAHRTHGTRGLLQVWGKGLGDLCLNVPREHLVQSVAEHGPAAAPTRSCSGCYSEIQADWRVCKVCGEFLTQETTHVTRTHVPGAFGDPEDFITRYRRQWSGSVAGPVS